MNPKSTLPVHMRRTIFILGVYCCLETPARSAAEYAHQLHKKPKIFGLNSIPVPILISYYVYNPHFVRSQIVKTLIVAVVVIPAEANQRRSLTGIQVFQKLLDPGLRRGDEIKGFFSTRYWASAELEPPRQFIKRSLYV